MRKSALISDLYFVDSCVDMQHKTFYTKTEFIEMWITEVLRAGFFLIYIFVLFFTKDKLPKQMRANQKHL